jgi:cytochrome c553
MKKIIAILGIVSASFAYTNCAMCHNDSYYPLDKLTPKEIVDKLHSYKKGGYGTMARIAKSLSEDDIKKVAQKYGKK